MITEMGYIFTESNGVKHFFPNTKALAEWIATKSVTTYESVHGITARSDRLDGSHIDCCFYEEATSDE